MPTTSTITESLEYKNLCETVAMFCAAKGLDETSRDQLATLIALAMHIGSNPSPSR